MQIRGEGWFYREACTRGAPSWSVARDDGAPRVHLPRGYLILPRQPPTKSSSIFVRVPFFDPIFEGSFGGLLVLKMGHTAYLRKALDVFFPMV